MSQVKLDLDATLGPAQELELPQGRLRYRERGSGPPILFVHGLLVNGALWRNVVDDLAADARCITPDWPLGSHELPLRPEADRTPAGVARMIADTMEALDLQDVTLVGNDSGGALSQMVVTSHPERVGRLVLTDCDAFDNFPPRMFSYLLWASRSPAALGVLLQSMRLRFMRRAPIAFGWLTKRPLPPGVSDAYALPILRDAGVRRDAAAFMVGVHKSNLDDVTARLGEFRRPVLIAWAPEDRFFPFEHAERLASIFPDSRLERIEDSRTFVSEDQPKRLAELIAAFVREPAVSDRKGALT
jgi:pimeloyl-ACP methyl ester carboxylesterase